MDNAKSELKSEPTSKPSKPSLSLCLDTITEQAEINFRFVERMLELPVFTAQDRAFILKSVESQFQIQYEKPDESILNEKVIAIMNWSYRLEALSRTIVERLQERIGE